jgi:hypothetical protein
MADFYQKVPTFTKKSRLLPKSSNFYQKVVKRKEPACIRFGFFLVICVFLLVEKEGEGFVAMLHEDPSPPKKPAYPSFLHFGDLGTLRKLALIVRDSGTCW